jgi:HK97 family phage portal protein
MIVETFEGLQALTSPTPSWSHPTSSSVSLYDRRLALAEIYAAQPNVRICVEFLARNVAELNPQIFRRVSDTDRVRLADHELAQWLTKPNPGTSRFRLFESLMGDLGIYFEAYWAKVRYRRVDGTQAIGLMRLPPEQMCAEGRLIPEQFIWTVDGRERTFDPSEIVYFNGYNPCNAFRGLSPLETLAGVLSEEDAAQRHREGYWRNSARVEGVVTRPKEKPRYDPTQVAQWREQWQAAYAGGGQAGKTVLLQDGETFTPTSWSAKDSEYVSGGKLRREVCAAEYHIPQPFVGILDHATFSNIKEQHKHLYQDTLGPWLEMITQELARQLLIECDDQENVYIEYNIAAKLAGTPEEQTESLVRATGRAFMTVNEARARVNLPRDTDEASDRIAPQQGGPADASAQPMPADSASAEPAPPTRGAAATDVTPVLEATRDRQRARLSKLPVVDRPAAFTADLDRWNRELAADLTTLTGLDETARAAAVNADLLQQIENDARDARLAALEQRPLVPRVDIHEAPITINVPPVPSGKAITLKRDATGAVVGADVV